jgi:hypothetical protein
MHTKMLGQGDFPDTSYYMVPPGLQTGCKQTKGSRESFTVDASQKWMALHFIGAMSLKIGTVSVDEHPMWIYAMLLMANTLNLSWLILSHSETVNDILQ